MNGLIIVAAQSTAIRGDLDAKIAGHLRLIHTAASFGADLVVFPELSLTGYELGLARELQLEPEDRRLEPLREAAREYGVHVLVGGPWRSGLDKPARRTNGKWRGAVYTGSALTEVSSSRQSLP